VCTRGPVEPDRAAVIRIGLPPTWLAVLLRKRVHRHDLGRVRSLDARSAPHDRNAGADVVGIALCAFLAAALVVITGLGEPSANGGPSANWALWLWGFVLVLSA